MSERLLVREKYPDRIRHYIDSMWSESSGRMSRSHLLHFECSEYSSLMFFDMSLDYRSCPKIVDSLAEKNSGNKVRIRPENHSMRMGSAKRHHPKTMKYKDAASGPL